MHEGLDLSVVAAVAASLVCWGLVSVRLERWNLTAPICFVAVGLALANEPLAVIHPSIGSEGVRQLAEFALAVVLFGDAASVELRKLRRDAALPGRLLILGLPLTISAGALSAHWLLPGTSWWVSAVIGAAVAPTDAALGSAILEDERVPARVRRVLNVESGLNDGIATPFVNFFIVAAVAGTAFGTSSRWQALIEIGLGVFFGAALGAAGGWSMSAARRRGLASPSFRAVGTAALSVLAFAGITEIGGNGFVAAFVAGLAFRGAVRATHDEPALGFTHDAGGLLSLTVWFIFGALVLPILRDATWRDVAFAVAALTIVRMAPVAVSLLGAGLDRSTVAVIGWFGPRGLASVVFAVLAAQSLAPDDGRRALSAVAVTVGLSVVLHGSSASPIAKRYGASHPQVP